MGRRAFSIYVADAFAKQVFGGNQAGVVLLGEKEDFPGEALMRQIAGEMKHSETAFVKRLSGDAFRVRYFTPVEEVALCGHATIGTFGVLYARREIGDGRYRLFPGAPGNKDDVESLAVEVCGGEVWMEMAPPRVERYLDREQALELYDAYGLNGAEELAGLKRERLCSGEGAQREQSDNQNPGDVLLPAIVNTGLSDIILPVSGPEALGRASQDCGRVAELSRRYQCVGVHMFYLFPEEEVTACCRNFAPAVGIDEESATGTANGALTWYLSRTGLLGQEKIHTFLQGEAMGKPSYVRSRLEWEAKGPVVKIGGGARISLKGEIYAEDGEAGQEGKL